MVIKDRLNKILDTYALIAAMIADIGILLVCFIVVSPGIVEAVAMGILSGVVVLFAVRSWLKGGLFGKIIWGIFAVVAFFFDLSFMLVSTDVQSQSAIKQDSELVRLETSTNRAMAALDKAQTRYDEALKRGNSRAVLDGIKQSLDAAQATYEANEAAYSQRLNSVESTGHTERVPLTADNLSTAIYDAAISGKPGRITYLVVFGLLFLGLILTIVSAAEGTKKLPEEVATEPEPAKRTRHVQPKPISPMLNIVTKLYYNSNRTNGNNRILKFGSMSNYLKGAIGKEQYHEVVAKLKAAGLVSEDGIILDKSPEKAMEVLK